MKKVLLLVSVLILGLSVTIYVQGRMECDKMGRMGMDKKMHHERGERGQKGMGIHRLLKNAEELGLTEEQQGKLKNLMVEFKLAAIDQKAKVQKAEVKLRFLMHDENASESAVMKAIDNLFTSKAEMKKILSEIQSGEFAKEFVANVGGLPARREEMKKHEIEIVGEKLRSMMPWIKANQLVDTEKN